MYKNIFSLQAAWDGNQLAKSGGLSLPPVPPQSLKGSGHGKDMHSLKLLYNPYLQWRFDLKDRKHYIPKQ